MADNLKNPEDTNSTPPTPKPGMGKASLEHQPLKKDRLRLAPDDASSGGMSAGVEGDITAGPETQQSPGILDSGTF